MENQTKVLEYILIICNIIALCFPSILGLIIAIISINLGVIYISSYNNIKFAKIITEWIYKLSFPYTTDEVIILNCMKVVNFFIGKRFQLLFYLKRIKRIDKWFITTDYNFVDDFSSFNSDNWRKDYPWGNGNNLSYNCYIENKRLITKMQKENYHGNWNGERDYQVTSGMIFSRNTYPVPAIYQAKVKFSNVDNINQAFWLIRLRDEPLPKIMEELDFEYHLTKKKITMSQHWGNGYKKEQFHRQDSFSFKIDLSKGCHLLKFKITKKNIYWYIDNVLVKWHFVGVPKLEQNIVFGMGTTGKTPEDIGDLDLSKLPAYFKCDYISVNQIDK